METLTVLHVSHSTGVWGAELALLRVAPLLAERGVDLRLASPPGTPLEQAWRGLGLPHVALEVPKHHGIRKKGGGRPSPRELAREAGVMSRSVATLVKLARGVDVVHSQTLNAHLEVAVAGRIARRPTVLQQHDLVAPGAGRVALTLAVQLSSTMLAITDACADCVHPPARHKVQVLRYGLDLERFSPGRAGPSVRSSLGGTEGVPLVGILGRIDPRKQIDVLIRAMAIVRREIPAHLVVVGAPHVSSPSYLGELESQAEHLLGAGVRFVGPRTDVPDVLRALDVLVNASTAEPFGLTLLEAQACGVPVVATRSGGAPEFVHNDSTGLLVPPGDVEALAKALLRLLTDRALRDSLVSGGRRQVEAAFDQDRQADAIVEAYRRLRR